MKASFCKRSAFAVIMLALALGAGSQGARAQKCGNPDTGYPCNDVFTVDYYANANTPGAPDAVVRVINPGTTNASRTEAADLCALIYVFDNRQELSECCGCFVSANALLALSVNFNLTKNPLLGTPLHTGVIKMISSALATPCDPTNITATETLREWATHIESKVGAPSYPILLGESQAAPLGLGEATDLAEDCTVLQELGSGAGACSCGTGHP